MEKGIMDKIKEQRIREKIAEYIIEMTQKYEKLKRDDLAINPFLAGALKLDSEEKIWKFFITQRLQRGIVTSFGSLLQEIAKILDSEANIEDIDLVIKKDNKIHYVQLKSGPEGFTRPALRKTKSAFDKLKAKDPKCVSTVAFCYGIKSQISKIWGKEVYESADIVLVGKEFWDYFFGDGFYEKLINIFKTIEIDKEQPAIKRKSSDEILKTVCEKILSEKATK
ncbi:MAG: TdeIII family type II restriction endonuclease [Candidatus Omnitrophica bacterium]|nr:TdeIII family type II restriction endonuclease [Candidatus Omnitrophota bacterium]